MPPQFVDLGESEMHDSAVINLAAISIVRFTSGAAEVVFIGDDYDGDVYRFEGTQAAKLRAAMLGS